MDNDDNNSNASDKCFKHDEEYQKEFDNDKKKGDEELNTDESQEDHFNLPLQQHHTLFTDHPKSRSVKSRSVESRRVKKPKAVRYEEDDYYDNDNDDNNVDNNNDDDNDNNGTALVEAGVNVPYNKLVSDF